MRRIFYSLLTSGLLAGAAQAQIPSYQPQAADLNGTAARSCALTHQKAALRQPATTVAHRQKMERYDVKYYKLNIALENNSRNVGGSVRMLARAGAQSLDSLAFELYPTLTIDSVVVNKKKVTGIRRALGDVTVGLAQAAPANALFDAYIYYRGTAPNGNSAAIGNALDTDVDPDFGTSVTWSLSEPFNAYEWWPCKQVLTDKADSSDVWVTTSNINKVGSNGVLERVTPQSNGKSRYEWKSRYPIDYYLISVAVAPYVEYVNYANPAGGPRIPIVNYLYNTAALNYYRTEIDRTPGFIENYSNLVGLYPFAKEKYGHSMGPIGGGMEHQTMTTQDGFSFTLTAHELFHQWFGDNVTCASWQDIWLNEGFASYGEYLSLNAFSTPAQARSWMDNAHATTMQSAGGSVLVLDTTNVNRIFSPRLSYKKGAAVIHMLRYLLNDDVKFFRALRTYQTQFAGSTARTTDLQRIFEAEAGVSLDTFFRQWYRGEGYPTFTVRWNQVGTSLYLKSTETVSMPTVTPFFDTEVDYKINYTNGTSQTVRRRQSQAETSFTLPVAGTVSSIQVDPDQWLLNGSGLVSRDNTLATKTAAAVLPLAVYPNPCRETLQLGSLTMRTAQAVVTDLTGRVVLRQTIGASHTQLSTAALAPGLYHLQVTTPEGEVSLARFVRE
ncbi:M1 family aminopeptidase [Hymenobacter chitinivorans]|uniref:Aminopeptidase N n=1 Tax=Hymenobacter chitinivorans DSM 11115 TaxID=1121954 RepID=A0A2M9BQQ8_9BACT|nr:M1 family aminopeptidase [Hymenobacter chitinivorans]PJJ60257.1 putative secreted protein (Por secretion system target) [Hymenobacter chitinivorans DSM 11115]